MTNELVCPHCERGKLQVTTLDEVMQFRGAELLVPGLEGFKCLSCGEITISPAQIRANHAIYVEKKAEAANLARLQVGMLSGDEIRQLREQLGLSQVSIARALGCAPMTFSKYERGEVMQSAAVDVLLQMIRAVPAAASYICARAGVKSPERWKTVVVKADEQVHQVAAPGSVVVLGSRRSRSEPMPSWETVHLQRCG